MTLGRLAIALLLTSPIVEGTTPCVTFHEEVSAAAASLEKWEQHLIDVQNSVRDARRLLSTRQLQLAECASSGTDVKGGIEGSGDLHMGRSPAAPVQMLTQPPDVPRKRSESDAESGGNDEKKFVAARCWGANSSFSNPACGCLTTSRHEKFDSRPIIRIIVGNWKAAELDSWLLKIVIEQHMGWPVQLHPDSEFSNLKSRAYEALGTDLMHIYPEVAAAHIDHCPFLPPLHFVHGRCGNRMKANCTTCGSVKSKR
jgi:hypothetical protein